VAISIDWPTKVITINQSDCTLISGTLYELDTDTFRLALKALEDDEEGMPWLRTHKHNTEVTIAGVTYARFVEIINGYSVTFSPNSQWSVKLTGSNNNIWDVENGILNQNQVQVIPTNSAGLITISTGSGLSTAEHDKLMALETEYLEKIIKNKRELKKNGSVWELVVYDDNGTTELLNKELKDKDGNNITDLAAGTLAKEMANSV